MNSIYVYKAVRHDADYYNLIVAVDYADAKGATGANSLYKLSKTDTYFGQVSGSQAVYKRIYDLAKSGIKEFDQLDNRLVFGKNKEIFAEREDLYHGDFELIKVKECLCITTRTYNDGVCSKCGLLEKFDK